MLNLKRNIGELIEEATKIENIMKEDGFSSPEQELIMFIITRGNIRLEAAEISSKISQKAQNI